MKSIMWITWFIAKLELSLIYGGICLIYVDAISVKQNVAIA